MKRPAATWAAIPQQLEMRRTDTALGQHPVRPQILVAPGGAIGLEAGATGRRRARGHRRPGRALAQKPTFWTPGASPCERQARQAGRIDAAGPRPRHGVFLRRRGVVDRNAARGAFAVRGEGAEQAGGVEPIAAGDPPEPGREELVTIGARRDWRRRPSIIPPPAALLSWRAVPRIASSTRAAG